MAMWTPPSYDRLVERGRQYCLACVLLMAAVHDRFIAPFMVLAFLLAALHLVRHHRQIPFASYWPLALPPLFYTLSLLNLPGFPWNAAGEVAPMLRVGYLLAPLALIDLRPTRLWGTVQIWGGVAVTSIGLAMALYHSLSYVDGQWVWWVFNDSISREEALSAPSHFFWSGYTYFFYSGFTLQIGLFPSFVGFTLLISLIISAHRLVCARARATRYWIATLILLGGFVLVGSRTMYLGALCCLGLLVAHLAMTRKLAWYVLAAGLATLCTGSYFIAQQPRIERLLDAIKSENTLDQLMQSEQRIEIWYEAYLHRREYLPWGMGTSRSRPKVTEWMAERCEPYNCPTKMHNECLEALAEQGWIGLGCMGLMMILPLLFIRRFRPAERMLWVPLYVLMTFESMSSIAIGVASLAFTYSILWSIAIWRKRGLSDGMLPHL